MNALALLLAVLALAIVWFTFLKSIAPSQSYSLALSSETASMLASCYGHKAFARLDFTWPSAFLSAT